MPQRIQIKRIKGWQMPENAVYVGRPTRWGNHFKVSDIVKSSLAKTEKQAREIAFRWYGEWLSKTDTTGEAPWSVAKRQWIFANLDKLKGKDLACWCPPGEPCHAEILLKLVNPVDEEAENESLPRL